MAASPDLPFNLKHRLIGALILVGGPVIILPLLLTGAGYFPESVAPSSDTLLQPSSEFISKIDPVTDSTGLLKTGEPPNDSLSTGSQKEHQREVDLPDSPAKLTSGWVVRVGVFGELANANKRRSTLEANDMIPQSEEIELNGRRAVRLYLGPFSTEIEAERESAKAVLVTGEQAFVVRTP
ncbi:MAG: SPOR domain-containing protein [Arenicellales bacterium]|jgi:cell division septation protein DedD